MTRKQRISKAFSGITPKDRKKIIDRLKISEGYLYQLTSGCKVPSAKTALDIERILGRPGLSRKLRPDIFGKGD